MFPNLNTKQRRYNVPPILVASATRMALVLQVPTI